MNEVEKQVVDIVTVETAEQYFAKLNVTLKVFRSLEKNLMCLSLKRGA